MLGAFYPVLLVVGLMVGSFLTVLVSRLASGETAIWGRSHCVHCGKILRWYELLPALSFIAQGGQCRSCHQAIPRWYLAIELTSAGLFLAIGWAITENHLILPRALSGFYGGGQGASWEWLLFFAYYAFFAASAVLVSFYDALTKTIPMLAVYALGAIGLAIRTVELLRFGDLDEFLLTIAAGLGAFLFFRGLWFLSKGRALGRGDAGVALAIVLYLGPIPSLVGLVLAFWVGAVFGLAAMALGKLGWKSEIPFAPFLFGGALLALFSPVLTLMSFGLGW
ncbi:MAG: prepilin peptidase [Candidatus Sungbacteria bacterium]|nr:prepilin peptidase [Candidatus Sungbacteria bacterium]